MAEINNNITSFGRNIEKIETAPKESTTQKAPADEERTKTLEYIPDTGILGRSQVKKANGGNIAKSVDEAVALAKEAPALLCGCESIFDCVYKDFINQGMEPSEAYTKALLAEEEFMQMGRAYNR